MSGWISVKDRMPDDSYTVAVYGEDCCDLARWNEGEWHIECSIFNPTHWMPLPASGS